MRQRRHSDHVMTSGEKSRLHNDTYACIDTEMNEAIANIDWKRRNNAEKSLAEWTKTYMVNLLLEDEPPEKGIEILQKMEEAITSHKNYMILMGRGQGKSVFVLSTTLFSILTGTQKLLVLISNNARASCGMLDDIWRCIAEKDTPLIEDYPELLPFQLCNNSFRRRQLYNGTSTDIQKNAANMSFPILKKEDGTFWPCSGATIATRSISSGLRGLRKGKQRVTGVILDDLQDSEIAENPEQVNKLLNLIKKDIMPMAGKQRLSILQTATPICQDDLVEHIKNDTNWTTQLYPAIISFPKNMELWKQYFQMFDNENVNELAHDQSLSFYRKNFKSMNEGAEVFNPKMFSVKDGHISTLQKLLELRHVIGDAAFASEYQMKPQKYSFSLEISPKVVVSKMNDYGEGIVPDGFTFVAASSDLNLSYCISTTILAFKSDMTAVVLKHIFKKVKIDGKLPDTEYNQKVFEVLTEHGKQLKALGIPINGWGIDSSGVPFNAVTNFCKNSMSLCGLPACAMLGKASHMFNGFVRSRLRDEINKTVLCGDPAEHIKTGSGIKYMFWDSDYYRELVQKSFLAPAGSQGSLTLWKDKVDVHAEYALQVCNERLKFVDHKPDGRNIYYWKTAEPHDMLDSTAQAFAVCASQGISAQDYMRAKSCPHRAVLKKRPKIRIV